MKILYVTDLHGNHAKYRLILEKAREHNISTVINGGDMLPKNNTFDSQEEFIKSFLFNHFTEYDNNKISYFCMFGNDDAIIFDELFDEITDYYLYIHNIAQRMYEVNGYFIIGFNLVNDYPFRFKDRCRKDNDKFILPAQLGTALLSKKDKTLEEIKDWSSYVNKLPTIETELKNLVEPPDYKKAIYVIHMPPSKIDLDVCGDKRKVGSDSVYEFIGEKQPFLSLHGHIHEIRNSSGSFMGEIKNTLCIQPGQMKNLTYMIIDLKKLEEEANDFWEIFEEKI